MIHKEYLMRILECSLLLGEGMSELKTNHYFTFQEIDKSKKVLEVIENDCKV